VSAASTRAALRIARRTALRSKGRSALILAMVAVPVFTLVVASVLIRTAEPSKAERITRAIGTADARLMRHSDGAVKQDDPYGFNFHVPDGAAESPTGVTAAALLKALPPGTQATAADVSGESRVRTGTSTAGVSWLELDTHLPLNAGRLRRQTGRLPSAPGEVLVTPALLRRIGAAVGDPLQLTDPDRTLTIVGTAVLPDALRERAVIAPLGAISGAKTFRGFYIDLPAGTDAAAAQSAVNPLGWVVNPREWVLGPPDAGARLQDEQVGVALVVGGLAAMEVILLAGAAFAVGARRQRRELGLVAATGGDRSHVRGVVLGGGVVVGVAAAVIGAVAGVAAAAALAPWLERRFSPALFGGFDARLTEVGGAALLGLVTAILAAVIPARTAARQPVVDALTGRRGVVRSPIRLTIVGAVAIGVGAFIAAKGATSPVHFNQILAGAVIAELGFVACSPAVVGLAGRLAGVLPLPLRLAVRDSARHRTRSGPAVAAVMAALAGAVAMSVYQASDTERQRREYLPRARPGQAILSMPPSQSAVAAAVASELPVRAQVPLASVEPDCAKESPCRGVAVNASVEHQTDEVVDCSEPRGSVCYRVEQVWSSVAVADRADVAVIAGPLSSTAANAFARGAAVVLDARLVRDGHVELSANSLEMLPDGSTATEPPRTVRLPAVVVGRGLPMAGANVIVSPATAEKAGWESQANSVLLDLTRKPTAAELDRVAAVLRANALPDQHMLYVEKGFRSDLGVALVALLGAAALVALGASVIATGLAAADGRPDLATLAAVGASPRVRRVLAMSQAATISFIGSVLGVLAGLVPAVAIINARVDFPLVIPWGTLALVVVAIPMIIAALAGIFTRSRLPLERRLA
jgi:putative ABC transport system permease protein